MTNPIDELIEKLNAWEALWRDGPPDGLMREAAAALSSLQEQKRKLEEALKPFVQASQSFLSAIGPDGVDDGLTVIAHIHARPEYEATLCTSDFSNARALLSGAGE